MHRNSHDYHDVHDNPLIIIIITIMLLTLSALPGASLQPWSPQTSPGLLGNSSISIILHHHASSYLLSWNDHHSSSYLLWWSSFFITIKTSLVPELADFQVWCAERSPWKHLIIIIWFFTLVWIILTWNKQFQFRKLILTW